MPEIKLSEKKKISLWQYFVIAGLAMLAALNYEIFIHPNHFAPAGVNGIATMVQYVFDFSIGYMSLLINIPMLAVAIFVLSREYSTRTLTYVLVFSIGLLVLQRMDLSGIIFKAEDNGSAMMAAIAAGVFNGTIYSLSVRFGGSTGGTDIVASFIHHKKPEYDTVWILFTLNAVVAVSSFFVYGFTYEPVILCIMYCFMSSRVSENMFKGSRSAVRFEVVTAYPEQLAEELMTALRHGCTVIEGKGMYSKQKQYVLICIVNRRQTVDFQNILNKYDKTFAYVSSVNETFGNFKKIK